MDDSHDRLARQIDFILELDRLKTVVRASYLLHEDRRENSAEHSWHVAMLAMVLAEHADGPVDGARVARMLMVHDVVEIDAGDASVYDEAARIGQAKKEGAAAARIFGLLPEDQGHELHALWQEFEAGETPDARFGQAIDRLMPLLHNLEGGGRSWKEHSVGKHQVLDRNAHMARGSRTLWDYTRKRIEAAAAAGDLAES
jgi:putative hydrolases of HD superfamily